jgi:uncharacterized membrane protein
MRTHAVLAAAALAVVVAVALAPAPARASFKVCNSYNQHINTAVAYYSKEYDYFISEGWWGLDPGQCKTAIGGDLKDRYIYVYAVNNDDSWEWAGDDGNGGSYSMCVNPNDPFTLYNAQNKCTFEYKKFRQVDTGDYASYSYSFK